VAFVSQALVSSHLAAGELVGYCLRGAVQRRGRSVVLLPGRQDDVLLKDLLECIFRMVSPDCRPQQVTVGRAEGGDSLVCGRE